MKNNRECGVEEYVKRVSACLHCSWKQKRVILSQVRATLREIPDTDKMSYDQLLEIVDPPERVAEIHLDNVKTESVFHEIKQKKHFRVTILILALLAVVLLAVFVADTWRFTHGHWEYSGPQSGISTGDPNAYETY